MPTVRHMAGTHDARVESLRDLAALHGWQVSLVEGYEHRLPADARRVLWSQTNRASHEVRNRPDLLIARTGLEPAYWDVKTTTFRRDTGMNAVELYPAYRAWLDFWRGIVTYFDLDGLMLRADHLRALVRRILIPAQRWPDGSPGSLLYHQLASELCPGLMAERGSVSPTDATGDPFVLIPRGALSGRCRSWCARSDDFIALRVGYQPPRLSWPIYRPSMADIEAALPKWTLEAAAHALDFTPDELRPWWERRRRQQLTGGQN